MGRLIAMTSGVRRVMGIGGLAVMQDTIRYTYLLQSPEVCRNRPSYCAAPVMIGHCSNVGGRSSGGMVSRMYRRMLDMTVGSGVPLYPCSESYPLMHCCTLSMDTVIKWEARWM